MNALKITTDQIKALALRYGVEYAALMAVITVESSGNGFSAVTGKIIIQFEPSWFKRTYLDWRNDTKHTVWQANKVGDQTAEWKAFNDAFDENADAAMKSTSIGLMQVMGFHFRLLGFATVGAMWDFGKVSESNQVELGLRFIQSQPALYKAMKNRDWPKFAYYYNGENYRVNQYDLHLLSAYNKYNVKA